MPKTDEKKRELIIRHELQQDRDIRIYRSIIIFTVIMSLLFYEYLGITQSVALWIAGILGLILTISVFRLFFWSPKEITDLEKYLTILAELLALFFIVLNTGGIGSPYLLLFPVTIAYYAVRFPLSLTITSAMLATFLIIIIIGLNIFGIFDYRGSPFVALLFIVIMWIVGTLLAIAVRNVYNQQREIWEEDLAASQAEVQKTAEELQAKKEELESTNIALLEKQRDLEVAQQRAQLRIHELAYMRTVSDSLINIFTMNEILIKGAEVVAQAIGIDKCDVYVFEDHEFKGYLKREFSFEDNKFTEIIQRVSTTDNRLYQILKNQEEPLLIESDVENDEYRVPMEFIRQYGFQSSLLLPIYSDKVLLAVYGLNNSQLNHNFTRQEIQLADTLVHQIENFIARAKLFQEMEHQRRESEKRNHMLHLINSINQVLLTTLDRQEIFSRIVHEIGEAVSVDRTVLFIHDEERNSARMVGEYDRSTKKIAELGLDFPLEKHNMLNQIVRSRLYVNIDDTSDPNLEDQVRESFLKYGIKSLVMAPMIFQGKVVGIIGLDELHEQREFTNDELELITVLANQSAIAIVNAQLYAEGQLNLANHQSILDMIREVSVIDDYPALLKGLTDRIGHQLQVDRASLLVLNSSRTLYETQAVYDVRGETYESPAGVYDPRDLEYFDQFIEDHDIIHVPDIEKLDASNEKMLMLFRKRNIKSTLLIPLYFQAEPIGVFILSQVRDKRTFTGRELQLCRGFADQASIAIHNLRLHIHDKKQRHYWSVLMDTNRQIFSCQTLKTMFDDVVEIVQRHFDYEHLVILVVDEIKRAFEILARSGGFLSRFEVHDYLPLNKGIVGKVYEAEKTIVANNVQEDLSYYSGLEETTIRSQLTVPMIMDDVVVGVFNVESERLNAFDDTDIKAFETLVEQMTLAIKVNNLFATIPQD